MRKNLAGVIVSLATLVIAAALLQARAQERRRYIPIGSGMTNPISGRAVRTIEGGSSRPGRKLGDDVPLPTPPDVTNLPVLPPRHGVHEFTLFRVDDILEDGFISRMQKFTRMVGLGSHVREFTEERAGRMRIKGVRTDILTKGGFWEGDTNRLVYVTSTTNAMAREWLDVYEYKQP